MTTLDPTYLRFIEENLPNYYSNDLVLRCDILCRYLFDEEVSASDLAWIHKEFRDKKEVLEDLKRVETYLFAEALDNYYSIVLKDQQ